MSKTLLTKGMHVLKDSILNFLKSSLIREKREEMKLQNKLTVSLKDHPWRQLALQRNRGVAKDKDDEKLDAYQMVSINCKYKKTIQELLKDVKEINLKQKYDLNISKLLLSFSATPLCWVMLTTDKKGQKGTKKDKMDKKRAKKKLCYAWRSIDRLCEICVQLQLRKWWK